MFPNPKDKKISSQPNQCAFTLIEMVIAVAIFSIAIVIISGIFLSTIKAQRKASAILEAQAEARYALEVMTRKIREGYIDYDYSGYSGGITSPEVELALKDLDGNPIIFFQDTTCDDADSSPCIKMSLGGNTQLLTGKGLKVNNLKFYISPLEDPFIPDFDPSTGNQPRVTIVMTIQSVGTRPEQIATVFLQTTASSRYYQR